MVVYTDSPKAVANQKAVMEYLLINHPLDCPVCDQAGECFLQDYSYQYGRGVSRFEEQKVKQPKKDLGPHVCSTATAASCAPAASASRARSPAPANSWSWAAATRKRSTSSPASPLDNDSPPTSSTSARSAHCSTRTSSSPSACGS
jgi:hypothetical protein